MFDVKLTRPTSQVIIAGPYETAEEAQMHATRLGLDFQHWKTAKLAELEGFTGDEMNKEIERRQLLKFIADNETLYEIVPHKRGGI